MRKSSALLRMSGRRPSFVKLSGLLDRSALAEPAAISAMSVGAAESATSESELLDAYDKLRTRAMALARATEWATPEQMADQFPSLIGLREIEHLNAVSQGTAGRSVSSDDAAVARVRHTLIELAAWAKGITTAYQALDRDLEDGV